jgi:hypothetical protein
VDGKVIGSTANPATFPHTHQEANTIFDVVAASATGSVTLQQLAE